MLRIRVLALPLLLAAASAPLQANDPAPAGSAATPPAAASAPPAAPAPQSGLHCLRATGSHLKPGPDGCMQGVYGSTIDREEFEQRSGFSTSDFLKYDPSLNVH